MLEAATFLNKNNVIVNIFVLYLENLVKNIRKFISNILISSTKKSLNFIKIGEGYLCIFSC